LSWGRELAAIEHVVLLDQKWPEARKKET